jgi:hypothetical protein
MISSRKLILAFLLATTATAQHWVGVRAGMINYAEGVFYIDQEQLKYPDARFREIPQGKSLRTGDGWVEVQLGPNAFLWMGDQSELRVEDPSLTNIQLRIDRGSVIFEVSEQPKENKLTIRFGEVVIVPRKAGLYRLDSAKPQLSVFAGKADVLLAGKKATVKPGKAALLTGNLKTTKFDMKQTDPLQEVAARRSQLLNGVIQEALMRSGNMQAMMGQHRWYEARQQQQFAEQMGRIQRDMVNTQVYQQEPPPIGLPGTQQEGHPFPMSPQMQQSVQGAIDNARTQISQPPPQNPQPQQ